MVAVTMTMWAIPQQANDACGSVCRASSSMASHSSERDDAVIRGTKRAVRTTATKARSVRNGQTEPLVLVATRQTTKAALKIATAMVADEISHNVTYWIQSVPGLPIMPTKLGSERKPAHSCPW